MAMIQLGMGETGVTTTGEPTGVDKFIGGAKVWLNPSYITTEMAALWAGLKADTVGTLTNPRALGFLLVPAAILAVVLGMKSARARRARNPRRVRRANPRRRVARGRRRNPTQDLAYYQHSYQVRIGGGILHDGTDSFTARQGYAKAARAARDGWISGRVVLVKDGSIIESTPGKRRIGKRRSNPKRRRNAGAGSVRHTKKGRKILFGGMRGTYSDPSWGAAKRIVRRGKSGKRGKRSRSRGTHRVKNGGSWVSWGHSVPRGYTPGPGKKFQLGGRFGVVKSVYQDEDGTMWVQFRRAVDGTTGMSLANFRQAAYIE